MEWVAYLDHIRTDGELLARAGDAGLDADAPCCPDWTVGDVVAHTGAVHRHKTAIVAGRLSQNPESEAAPEHDVVDWYRDGLNRLLESLADADQAESVYSWVAADQTVGFWYQRMAHETLIHRVDAEQGHGRVSPIDPELAADGIDEVLTKFVGGYPEWGTFTRDDGTVRIACNDRPRQWDTSFGTFNGTSPSTGTEYEDLEALEVIEPVDQPDAVIEGTAADLDLWLWGRGPLEQLQLSGDEQLAHRLRRLCAENM